MYSFPAMTANGASINDPKFPPMVMIWIVHIFEKGPPQSYFKVHIFVLLFMQIALFYVTLLAGLLQGFPVNFSQNTTDQLRTRKSGGSRGSKVAEQGESIIFADVAAVDEAKEELEEIVEFLRNPDKY